MMEGTNRTRQPLKVDFIITIDKCYNKNMRKDDKEIVDPETAKAAAKEIAIDKLNKRNTETVEVVLRVIQKDINDLKIVLTSLNNTMGGLMDRQNQLEQKVNIQKVQLMGLGPSVKE